LMFRFYFIKSQFQKANPTLKPYSPFNPNDDCAKLYKAMKGIGTGINVT